MKQEVQVTVVLTLWADARLSKKYLRNFANELVASGEDMIENRLVEFTESKVTRVREEAEIYGNR